MPSEPSPDLTQATILAPSIRFFSEPPTWARRSDRIQPTEARFAMRAVKFAAEGPIVADCPAPDPKDGVLSGIPIVLFVTRRQPGAGPGRGGGQHLIR